MASIAGRMAAMATALCLMGSAGATRAADDAAEFYKGKTVTVYTPDASGGGYDAYGRLVANFIGAHIPGKPSVIVQNMPGANGLIQVNHLYNTAPKDGTVLAITQHGMLFAPIFDPREVRFKVDGLRWLGSVTPITVIGVFRKDAAVQKVQDLFEKEVIIGGGGGTQYYLPLAVNNVLKTKMKLVGGYNGSNEVLLAMARSEVWGVVGLGLDSLMVSRAGSEIEYNILFQLGAVRSKHLPDVPLIQEFAKTEEDREVLEAICASCSIGRIFFTPNIPDDRYETLRKAFQATIEDPAFVEQAKKQHLDVGFLPPAEVQKIISRVYSRPEAVLKRTATAMTGKP